MVSLRPKVTVVVTCYNREKYLGSAIESVLASGFEEFDLLVLDDGSTDGSVDIARSYAERDERVRVIENETNLGDYPNRNRALDFVQTEFLKYHDSDDLMYPHCLGVLSRLLQAAPSAGFALTAGKHWPGGPCPMLMTPRMAFQREFLGSGMFSCGPSGALFRTSVLRDLGGFPNYGTASDYAFWLRACKVTNTLLVPADLFWYRVHSGQELQKPEAARHYALAQAHAWKSLFAPDCPLTGDELNRARGRRARDLLKVTWRDLRDGRWSLIPFRFRHAGFGLLDLLRYPPFEAMDPFAGTPRDGDGEFLVPESLRRRTVRGKAIDV